MAGKQQLHPRSIYKSIEFHHSLSSFQTLMHPPSKTQLVGLRLGRRQWRRYRHDGSSPELSGTWFFHCLLDSPKSILTKWSGRSLFIPPFFEGRKCYDITIYHNLPIFSMSRSFKWVSYCGADDWNICTISSKVSWVKLQGMRTWYWLFKRKLHHLGR